MLPEASASPNMLTEATFVKGQGKDSQQKSNAMCWHNVDPKQTTSADAEPAVKPGSDMLARALRSRRYTYQALFRNARPPMWLPKT